MDRKPVRSLEIDWFRNDHGNGTPRHLIRPENLDLLARAAEETLPDLTGSTDLCEQIRQGWDDGIAVLVLAWTKNLTNLSLTIPSHIRAKDENGYLLLVLHFAKQVALRFAFDDPKSALPLPLEKLHTLNIQYENLDSELHVAHLSPFLHFPNLKSFSAYRIGDGKGRDLSYVVASTENNYSMPFPERTSLLESICIEEPLLSDAGIRSLLHVCKNLKVFRMECSNAIGPRSSTMLARSLVEHASSLEEVTLFIEDIDEGHWTPDSADTDELPECWKAFRKLKRAGIPIQHLLQMEDVNDPTTAKLNPGRLPESLEHLTIFHHQLHDVRMQLGYFHQALSGDTLKKFESDRHQALVSIQMLLEGTRPTGHLKKLKTIDFSDALLDDPIAEEIRIVKDLAKERGVEFILGRAKR
ncbi:hypothetical protein FLAG1_11508 [Fusarium langsethiae]|uniref:Uncharacterized protein n=1 Tax=Fusarium langsethiae TaxID=179993 RepID=A0A0N0DAW2_FUSLA|nr:hypothetical protein FLAG1_11508 [Fusarium langsethiae]